MKRIVVTGDVTIDWHIARGQTSPAGRGSADDCPLICQQRGGAALLADLLRRWRTASTLAAG